MALDAVEEHFHRGFVQAQIVAMLDAASLQEDRASMVTEWLNFSIIFQYFYLLHEL
ncbi:MAG: hypothetical protein RBQ88_12655 [Desulfobulbus oligotrophicus]|nr:hypothetical protein [Desulfobulbus oligotrophicus]